MLKLTEYGKKFEHCKVYEEKTDNRNNNATRIGNKSFLPRTRLQ